MRSYPRKESWSHCGIGIQQLMQEYIPDLKHFSITFSFKPTRQTPKQSRDPAYARLMKVDKYTVYRWTDRKIVPIAMVEKKVEEGIRANWADLLNILLGPNNHAQN